MKDIYSINKEKDELQEYVSLDGVNEQTECYSALLLLANYPHHISDDLKNTLTKEILSRLHYYQHNTKLDEIEVTTTRIIRELTYLD